MSQSVDEQRDFVVDVFSAVLLGLFTSMAAFAAYQASLWGGNQATAYTSAINILGEANRELLRGVQDHAFDTTIWVEQLKAREAQQAAEAAEEAAEEKPGSASDTDDDNDDDDDDDALTSEQRAERLAAELAYAEDEPIARQLHKVLQSRRELVAAIKWSQEQHEKRTQLLPPQKRLELANVLVALAEKSEALDAAYEAAVTEMGLTDLDDDEVALALDKNPTGKQRLAQLEQDSLATQAAIDDEMDKLAAPMFFDSPTYVRSRESRYTSLLEKGNRTFLDGQQYNAHGDRFTLATVIYTVAMFFAGLGAVLRRFTMRVAFLGLSVLVAGGALWYMLQTPFA